MRVEALTHATRTGGRGIGRVKRHGERLSARHLVKTAAVDAGDEAYVRQPSGRRAPQLAEPLRDVVDIREREELGLACVHGAYTAPMQRSRSASA